jgi:hypothetical protein
MPKPAAITARIAAAVAALFGVATIVAGGRVLLGADPGYEVFRPLLVYNTAMGAVYLAAGFALWRNIRLGKNAAGAIFLLNLIVLAGILAMRQGGGAVAVDSLRAMTFRTAVWLALFLLASLAARAQGKAE